MLSRLDRVKEDLEPGTYHYWDMGVLEGNMEGDLYIVFSQGARWCSARIIGPKRVSVFGRNIEEGSISFEFRILMDGNYKLCVHNRYWDKGLPWICGVGRAALLSWRS